MSSATETALNEGSVLRVTGPARVEVVAGTVLVVGSKFSAGSSFVVHKYRSYGVKAIAPSKLRLTLGEGSKAEEVGEGEEVIDEWLKASELILRKCSGKQCRVLVIGPPESGKSTFTAFSANYLREAGFKVGVIEGDVGQEDILVPTTVALAEVSKPVLWLRELEPASFRFVGCTSPQYCYSESILAIKELVDEAIELGFKAVLVNTDGWVGTASGLEHKLAIIRWVRPDIIVATDREICDYVSRCVGNIAEVLHIPRPAIIRERSREERRELRIQAYKKYFSKAKVRKVKLRDVGLLSACSSTGRVLLKDESGSVVRFRDEDLNKVLYLSKLGDTLFVVAREPVTVDAVPESAGKLVVVTPRDARGTILGLLGGKLRDVGVGIVLGVDLDSRELAILTPWEGEIRGLIVGKIKLSEDLDEVGRVSRCTL